MNNNKKSIFIAILLIVSILCGCNRPRIVRNYSNKPPVQFNNVDEANLNFTVLHNYVIDNILSQMTPFFFVQDNTFEISGTNGEYKSIKITATCDKGTIRHDLDLFLSLVLYYIGEGAAVQYDVYKVPTVDSEGTHLDFGTVFNEYSIVFDISLPDNKVLLKETVDAGDPIPVDPKYWGEENG